MATTSCCHWRAAHTKSLVAYPGFKAFRPEVHLSVGQEARLDVTLYVAAADVDPEIVTSSTLNHNVVTPLIALSCTGPRYIPSHSLYYIHT